jgi:hypothetical protein
LGGIVLGDILLTIQDFLNKPNSLTRHFHNCIGDIELYLLINPHTLILKVLLIHPEEQIRLEGPQLAKQQRVASIASLLYNILIVGPRSTETHAAAFEVDAL